MKQQSHNIKNMYLNQEIVFLGGGSFEPFVESVDLNSGTTQRLIELESPNSVYAIDVDISNGKIAVGTKAGMLYIWPLNIDESKSLLPNLITLNQGSPILSTCWLTATVIAASDAAGRCLIWSIDEKTLLNVFSTSNNVMCSLLKIGNDILSGLSTDGKLYFWNVLHGQVIKILDVPIPPPTSGFVNLFYWSEENLLVFPDSEGNLILFNLSNNNLIRMEAHQGGFYAISIFENKILTVGVQDKLLKIWSSQSANRVSEFEVPNGMVGLAVAGVKPSKLIMIDIEGKVKIFQFVDNKLILFNKLPIVNCRIVVAPDPLKISELSLKLKKLETLEIINKLRKAKDNDDHITDSLHSMLIKLGYEHVSLAIKAENALKKGNILESLSISHSLLQIIPKNDERACTSMVRYADLLLRTWNIIEADEICKRIDRISPESLSSFNSNILLTAASIINNNFFIIEPNIPIDQIILSATIIGKIFSGRYLIKRMEPEHCGRVTISSKKIADKFNSLRTNDTQFKIFRAHAKQVWLITQDKICEIQLVDFVNLTPNSDKRLQLALQVLSDSQGTVVVPLITFDFYIADTGNSFEDINTEMIDTFNEIKHNPLSNQYLASLYQKTTLILRRLVTKGLSIREPFDNETF